MTFLKKIASGLITLINSFIRSISLLLHVISQKLTSFKFLRLNFKPKSDDIFIATYPRSGTTLLQMILYQLTSNGEMDFMHISEKIPFFERIPSSKFGLDNLKSPRIFKTHLAYKKIPKGKSKYIYGVRNAKDVAISYYHHHQNYQNYKGSLSEFINRFLIGKVMYGSWFKHADKWMENKKRINIKVIVYDKLISNPKETIKEIADFCGIKVSDEKLETVVKNCSFENMKHLEDKFDHATELLFDNGVMPKQFLRKGEKGDWEGNLNDEQVKRFEDVCEKTLGKYNLVFD